MSYQFIKTVMTPQGEVAYLLDTQRGVIMKVRVEDHVGGMEVEEESGIVPAPYYPPRRTPMSSATSHPRVFEAQEEVEEEPPAPPAPPQPPRRKPQSLVPPHLRGVFIKPGKAGADVEHREV